MDISVIIPTHNPHAGRIERTLAGLRSQTLRASRWETLIVDNASTQFPDSASLTSWRGEVPRLVSEPTPGLTHARIAGLRAAHSELVVFVDDDNVLAPDYLEQVAAVFARDPQLGAAGGKSIGEFENTPPAWAAEFFDLLAIRDLGEHEEVATTARPSAAIHSIYPRCAPIGAGMVLRREAARAWLKNLEAGALTRPTDRTGAALTSGGDNDIVFSVLRDGWSVGYFPRLRLTHLIPASRLETDYLVRLNFGIQCSWVQVLALHQACPWRPIPPWTAPLRAARAYLRSRAWRSPAHRIRWAGLRGRFEGQAAVWRLNRKRRVGFQQ